jgi:TolB-like protein/Flp pilus assembly protein TadD
MKRLFDELLRRNVFRVAFAYLVVAWLVVQIVNNLVPLLDVPAWVGRAIFILIVAAFPIALILAWAFELTPEGLRRTSQVAATPSAPTVFGRKWDFAIIAALAIALGYSLWGRQDGMDGDTSAQPSIAVLPFVNFSSDPEQEYFSDGLSEELLIKLASLEGLRVTGRTSSFAFKGKDSDLRTIGEVLGVGHILEGSVRKSSDGQIRITAQLINAADGYQLWSGAYDRKLEDIFTIQDEISQAVADVLGVALGVGDRARQLGMTRNVAAYDEYLLGQALARETQPDTLSRAIEHFERAVALDPSFSLAWLGLSEAYYYGTVFLPDRAPEELARERGRTLERAREITPGSPSVLRVLAVDSLARGRWVDAARFADASLAAAAKYASDFDIDHFYGSFLHRVGRSQEARLYLERARAADPLDAEVSFDFSEVLSNIGDLDAAIAEQDRGMTLEGQQALLRGTALLTALAANDRRLIESRFALAIETDVVARSVNVAMFSRLDDPAAAVGQLRGLLSDGSASPIQVIVAASWAAYYGDADLALRALTMVPNDGFAQALAYTIWRPLMSDVRRLPGFKVLVQEMGLVDYWRAYAWPDWCRPTGDGDFECR